MDEVGRMYLDVNLRRGDVIMMVAVTSINGDKIIAEKNILNPANAYPKFSVYKVKWFTGM